MIADVPAFTYPLDLGPATHELSFVVGTVNAGCYSTWAALEAEPRRVEWSEEI